LRTCGVDQDQNLSRRRIPHAPSPASWWLDKCHADQISGHLLDCEKEGRRLAAFTVSDGADERQT